MTNLKDILNFLKDEVYKRRSVQDNVDGNGGYLDFDAGEFNIRTILEIHLRSAQTSLAVMTATVYARNNHGEEWMDTGQEVTIAIGDKEKAETMENNMRYIRVKITTTSLTHDFVISIAQ